MKQLIFILSALISCFAAGAQTNSLTQKVRGQVVDAESKEPLSGVVVVYIGDRNIASVTDSNGYFSMDKIPVGRRSFQFSYMGFEPYTASETMVIAGKELELNVSLTESLNKLKEVTISANKDRTKPLNEYAAISARSFSVEETKRYAASFADPARMVMNFPGVSNSGDGENSIVVRGNSPKGILWRLEGIEIPNPNHFGSLGAAGGAISMLNGNVLGNSDFYTGAFAPEIGNALAGVFDINFRNGNTERYEHSVQIGTLGAEIATEGPFKKGKRASYLLNYRYSTLALLKNFVGLGAQLPAYQDAAIKLNFPTQRAGTFTVFGLGGYNRSTQDIEADSSKWNKDDNENIGFDVKGTMAVAGVSHQYFVKKDAYIKTILSASYDKATEMADTLNPKEGYISAPINRSNTENIAYRAAVMYNQKLSARNTFRTGIIAQQMGYDFDYNYYDGIDEVWKNILSGNGSTQFYQAYVQWKTKLSQKLTLVGGLHGSYLALNEKYSIEPRASLAYQQRKSKYTLAAGLHSKPEHISTYLFQDGVQGQTFTYPNKNLDLQRAAHFVAGYETALPAKLRLKVEAYYQHLYSIPVESDSNSSFSIINAENSYSLLGTKPLVSEGTGKNYGVDVSIERPFADNYYVILTGSLYSATYTDYKGREFNSRYNRGHQVNLIAGKEFKINASGRKIIGLNGKILYSGGLRESLIDLNKSIVAEKAVIADGKYFTEKGAAYFRADASVYYKINNKRATHSIHLDIQNVTNRQNYYYSYFDRETNSIKQANQIGLLPNLSYRIDFHW